MEGKARLEAQEDCLSRIRATLRWLLPFCFLICVGVLMKKYKTEIEASVWPTCHPGRAQATLATGLPREALWDSACALCA